jgi:hypothetical protein
VDTYAKVDVAVFGEIGVQLNQALVNLAGTVDSVQCIRKLGQHVVADEVHQATAALFDDRRHPFAAGCQTPYRCQFIIGHQPTVAVYIGTYESRESALKLLFVHVFAVTYKIRVNLD